VQFKLDDLTNLIDRDRLHCSESRPAPLTVQRRPATGFEPPEVALDLLLDLIRHD
jgi:hypothetical protein